MAQEEFLNQVAQGLASEPIQDIETEAIIDGLAQSELAGQIQNAADTYNLIEGMDEDLLRQIGEEVMQGFEADDASRTEWLREHAFWIALYMQKDYAENADPERSWGATESIPILTEACDQFQSRTFKVFFQNDNFVSAIPTRKTSVNRKELEDRADRVGKHMSYQLTYVDRTYKQDKDALFLGVALHGSFFTKTYFDQKLRRFKVDNVRPTDLVVNYSVGPVRIEDLKRKSHIIYTTVSATEEMVKTGYLSEAATPANARIDKNTYNTKVDELSGIQETDSLIKGDRQAVLIEQHCYLDFDGQGFLRPYIVTVDAAKRRPLRITIGYEADQQGNPIDDFKQVQYFTHYKYKENPDGFYGLGLGSSIGDLNSAVNIMLRQSIDAATLANDGNMSGFISERLGLEGDEIRMVLGKFRKIPDTVGDIANAIWTNKFPGPNEALLRIMQEIDVRAQRLGAVTEATTGSVEKVVQPTTLITQIEQALEQFSSVQIRLADSLGDELSKIYKINKKYLPLIEYYIVNDAPEPITRADYKDDMLIQPVFDPRYATQSQKVARAQAELEATLQNPVNQTRPQVYDAAFRRYFEALQVENIEELIPPQPQVQRIDEQFLENTYFIMPAESRPVFDVFPEQNHAEHLQKISQLEAMIGQLGLVLPPESMDSLFKHKLKHQGYLYGQLTRVIPTGQISTTPPDGGPNLPLAAENVTGTLSAAQAQLLNAQLGASAQGGGPSGSNGIFREGIG